MSETVKRKPVKFIEIYDDPVQKSADILREQKNLLLKEKEAATREAARLAKEQGIAEGLKKAEEEYQSKAVSNLQALTEKNSEVIRDMAEALAFSKKEYVQICTQTLYEITDLLIENHADCKNKAEFIAALEKAFHANDTRRFTIFLHPKELTLIRDQFPLRLAELCIFQEKIDLPAGRFEAVFEGGGVNADRNALKKSLFEVFAQYIESRFPKHENNTETPEPASMIEPEAETGEQPVAIEDDAEHNEETAETEITASTAVKRKKKLS